MKIANHLDLPIDAVTQKMAMLGRTGSGKTYCATKLAELMYDSGAQIIALDPVGVWWGLRAAKDGKGKGLSIPVLGGLHGDIPLEHTAGAVIADLIVDKGISVIIDVSQFEYDSHKARFAEDFGNRFFFRKKASPSAVHLFIEECQEFIPQNTQKGEEKMLHSFTRIWKLGRNFGIGGTLISQRPQEVNKKVLNQTECLFAFQLTGLHERKAVEDWVAEKGLEKKLADDLPKLQQGNAHIWSPGWLKISDKYKILEKKTFNASATPTVGTKAQVTEIAPIDLESLAEQMKATIDKAKENDPAELKKKIKELEKKVNSTEGTVSETKLTMLQKQHEREIAGKDAELDTLVNTNLILSEIINETRDFCEKFSSKIPLKVRSVSIKNTNPLKDNPKARSYSKTVEALASGGEVKIVMPKIEDKWTDHKFKYKSALEILKFLAIRPNTAFTKNQLGAMTGYAHKGGAFNNGVSELNSAGLIEKEGLKIKLASSQIDYIQDILGDNYADPGQNALESWLSKLGKCEKQIYQVLLQNPQNQFDKQTLGEYSGYEPAGGAFNNGISALVTLGLAERINGNIRLNAELLDV